MIMTVMVISHHGLGWSWNFGDGSSSTEKNPTHQYQNYGRYNVSLSVTDNDGYTDVSYTEITVVQKPTAHFSYSPSAPKLDDSIQFTDLSSAYNGTIATWSWNFGDGSSSTEKNPTHQYHSSGTYTVTLEVTDSNGLKRAKTTSISAKANGPPTSDFSYSPSSPKSDDSIQFTDLSYDSDGNIVSWSWNFGDGTSSSSKNPTHSYTKSDSFQVTLKVTDDDGAMDTKKTTLTINSTSTPGFELILVICAIALILFFKRKSKK
jgi:PKD repeat protein